MNKIVIGEIIEKIIGTIIGFTIITGPMFAGKTNMLIAILRKLEAEGKKVQVFIPNNDTRIKYDEDGRNKIVSHHSEDEIYTDFKIINVSPTGEEQEEIKRDLKERKIKHVFFEEAQFFSPSAMIQLIPKLIEMNIKVTLVGLDLDSDRKPFGVIPFLLKKAEKTHELKAICRFCRNLAPYTLWIGNTEKIEQKVVGGKREYTSVCGPCHDYQNKRPAVLPKTSDLAQFESSL